MKLTFAPVPRMDFIDSPEALREFEREMAVVGERPQQLTLEQRKREAAPFVAAIREWAASEKGTNEAS